MNFSSDDRSQNDDSVQKLDFIEDYTIKSSVPYLNRGFVLKLMIFHSTRINGIAVFRFYRDTLKNIETKF
ncbi:hypothetical protein [Leptospira santarosai]|uniref:hypothetical protein n=1 Tax=Leptospira santarosai TaxID=28183 RepID=UPI0002BE6671|nr:hypothetical protein [Leptospira santarosai]EMJ49317.1 hypothetical protein LEP1GSC169_1224 [Leptospira santarosai str. HAI1349]EMO22402.1 hypothetical protein LEP1GSC168_2375 [Leptospira santarosai str. HAI134]MDI7158082.1 hypothetical protein [Leptospira santarosai]MDI7182173.1 hypothetical protein [Leptospira santarosai]MDI7221064.1 hypothetical protein [Leptospira santarosai]